MKFFNTAKDDNERPKTCHKVLFKDLVKLPTRERPQVTRKKTFQTHLLTSDENQEIIRKSDREARHKEALAEAKVQAYKCFLEEEKAKKKKRLKRKTLQ